MKAERIEIFSGLLGEAMDHGISRLNASCFGRALPDFGDLLGAFGIDFTEDDVILKGRIFPQEFLVFLGAFVGRSVAGAHDLLPHFDRDEFQLFLHKSLDEFVVQFLRFGVDVLRNLLGAVCKLAIFWGHQ